jgi:predicted dehydrogenase
VERRTLIKSAGALAVGMAAVGTAATPRKRYALVGTGARAGLYLNAFTGKFRDNAELVALCDSNPGRLALAAKQAKQLFGSAPKTYAATQFDAMVREARPEVVVVTTPDATHDDYIVRSLDAGCQVLTEKPMTTTAEKAQRILDACKRNDRHVRVLFNYRYSPPRTQVKDLLMKGEIGDILSVDFHWLLNTQHGADYFRRWHGRKAISGGLMVHKATHHFDLVNWWLGTQPDTVLAYGKREYYTPAMARRMGLKSHHQRCRGCPEQGACTFYLDLAATSSLKALYLDNEHHDGYFRDQCVFRPEIDIEDTMNVIVRYGSGATLSYSLNACNSWEGYQIAFNGTKGRIEHEMVEQLFVAGQDGRLRANAEDIVRTRVIPLRGAARNLEPWTASGGHGGGDDAMLNDIFGIAGPDPYLRASDERGGAYSILVGAAANQCFETGQPVRIADLVTGLAPPMVAPMPSRTTAIPMPRRVDL